MFAESLLTDSCHAVKFLFKIAVLTVVGYIGMLFFSPFVAGTYFPIQRSYNLTDISF